MQFLSKGIVGVDAKTGESLWRYKEVAKGPAQAFTPVAVTDTSTAVPSAWEADSSV